MAPASDTLSVNEVAAVTNVSPRAVNEVVDNAILPTRFIVRGRGRALHPQACYLVAVYWGTSGRLTKSERVRIVNQLSDELGHAAPPSAGAASRWRLPKLSRYVLRDEFLTVDLRPILRQVEKGGDLLDEARAMVVADPDILGGMPVIKGTRIPVHDVAASIRKNVSIERILQAYPALTHRKITLAKLYADAHPPRGQPRRVADDIPAATLRSEVRVRRKGL
jgi:uncharacterized protein (DUF433 family)